MKNIAIAILLVASFGLSCSSISTINIFGKKTPHEAYEDKLEDSDLGKTIMGRQWLAASQTALEDPQEIQIPYKQRGNFQTDKPRALGLKFISKRGEKITFQIAKNPGTDLGIYADLFCHEGSEFSHLFSADTNTSQFSFDIEEPGSYILRLQPGLFQPGEYSLAVSVGPSLVFPVSGNKAKIESFWGDGRDRGKRSHEGIDIFAAKRTPVVAASDGIITGVKDGGIGGKTVWMRTTNKNIHLYYAHLDKQLVYEGQVVKKGETLGLVGNTGNAKYTASHLHFGIYTSSGPVDPLPFVNQAIKNTPEVPRKSLTNYLRLTKTKKLSDGIVIKANTLLVPLAVCAKDYITELPNGKLLRISFNSVESVSQTVGLNKSMAEIQYSKGKKS